ncbi:N-alpha-acetyltransferase 20-like [Brachionus plicatilis]|uniref:N-alpha-acetyltransferase 20 n=1 Tax=Brachionus plicatilis TaxID=10195 RepID=A0A3M7QAP8_BRAPC|nr:N-alpha-acetyltransferase 20-like [Brachionus plicatilis]
MSITREFTCFDLLKINNVNLDPLTENFGLPFYLQYLTKWPEMFQVNETISGRFKGYIMAKVEGNKENWHGHVTCLSVAPEFRRQGVSRLLMNEFEKISEIKNSWFCDLFVRVSNKIAFDMYTKFGYTVYRRVLDYYTGENDEDAFDMRKAMPRDLEKKSIIPLPHPVTADELD